MDRLYVIVRADLPAGLQLAQTGHAVMLFAERFAARPENLIVLHVADHGELGIVALRAMIDGCSVAAFAEPDLNGQYTAAAVHGPKARKLLADLPLAFAERSATQIGNSAAPA